MGQVDWVFLDVGNVILSDDPSVAFYYWELAHFIKEQANPSFAYQRFLQEREQLVRNGSNTPGADIARRYLSDDQWRLFLKQHEAHLAARYDALTPELPGIRDVVDHLNGHVHLGLIANQPVECVASLKRRGLWDAFSVHAISDVLGIKKPDPALFRWACAHADVPPERSLMVGDRLDNDVQPAQSLGMATVWLHWRSPYDKGIAPREEYESLYLDSLARVSPASMAVAAGNTPSGHVVHSVRELGALLEETTR